MATDSETPKTSESPLDLGKLMSQFDPNKLAGELQNMLTQHKLPGVDMEALVASQKKNLEAVSNANRAALEGLQALAKRQAELLQETVKEASQAVSSMSKVGSPSELVTKQADVAQHAFEKGMATMREMAEIVVKSNKETADTISARIAATLADIRNLTKPK